MKSDVGQVNHIEVVRGVDAVDAALRNFGAKATTEIVAFTPTGPLTQEQIKTAKSRNTEFYDRGVFSRTIYLDSVRNDRNTKSHVRWLNEHGSQVRTKPALPTRMLIADGVTAVLPLNGGKNEVGIKIYHDTEVVALLQVLFEQTWLSANPLGLSISAKNDELNATQRAVLEMLNLGCVDHEIGTRMSLDKRTIKRRVAEIMQTLDAKTRFQAGAKAAKYGLI